MSRTPTNPLTAIRARLDAPGFMMSEALADLTRLLAAVEIAERKILALGDSANEMWPSDLEAWAREALVEMRKAIGERQ